MFPFHLIYFLFQHLHFLLQLLIFKGQDVLLIEFVATTLMLLPEC